MRARSSKGSAWRLRTAAGGALALLVLVAGSRGGRATAQMARTQFVPSFEYNNRIKGQLTKLETLEHQKLWEEWLNTYQSLDDDNPDGVMPRDKEDQEFLKGLR